jgi:hypothetical protein
MSTESTAMSLAEKLKKLTLEGKISWKFEELRLEDRKPADAYTSILLDNETSSIIAEWRIDIGIASYSLYMASKGETFFEAFAEGYPADPTDEKLNLHKTLKELFAAARDKARGTREKLEQVEQLLERMA